MAQSKKLTIVVPVYNRGAIVGRTLDSIASQERIGDVKIILVDNNSTDDTWDVLSRWKSTGAGARLDVVLSSETTSGAPAARNNGLALVTTEWVMFFDSDDEMNPGLIALLLDEIDRDEADIIGWPIDIELADGSRRTGKFTAGRYMWNHLVHGVLATQRYAVKAELVRSVGGWDNSARGWNDFELGVRILLKNGHVKRLSAESLVTTHFTPESITGTSFSTDPDKWEHSLDLCEASLRAAGQRTTWIDVRRIILAADYHREGDRVNSRRLLRSTLSGHSKITKWILKCIFIKCRLYRAGTTSVASLLLSKNI